MPGKPDLVSGLKELSSGEVNQVLMEANFDKMDINETIVEAGFKKLRPHKARLIVTDCNFDKDIVISSLQERSHQELSSLFKAANVPFIVSTEAEIADKLRTFTTCQQKATLAMVTLTSKIILFDINSESKFG